MLFRVILFLSTLWITADGRGECVNDMCLLSLCARKPSFARPQMGWVRVKREYQNKSWTILSTTSLVKRLCLMSFNLLGFICRINFRTHRIRQPQLQPCALCFTLLHLTRQNSAWCNKRIPLAAVSAETDQEIFPKDLINVLPVVIMARVYSLVYSLVISKGLLIHHNRLDDDSFWK